MMKTLLKSAVIAVTLGFTAMAAQAATLSYTEGKRPQVLGTTVLSPTDATNAPPGVDLGSIGFGDTYDSIELHGRIVRAVDVFQFTSSSAFRIDFIFGGFDLENGGSESDSGFIREGSHNSSDFSLDILAPVAGSVAATTLGTDITSGLSFIFGADGAGTYQFAIDGHGGAARYDIRISAVPLPAGLPLMGAGLAVMGFVGWRRKQKASA